MAKIRVKYPIVDMNGDEMARVLWEQIRTRLILPHLDVELKAFDLGLPSRDATEDKITLDAAKAVRRYGVGVKCATITPDTGRMEEYHLQKMWKSPNGTIRNLLNGTIFRTPIMTKAVMPLIPRWKKPITVARHGFGDIYKAQEMRIEEPGTLELVYRPQKGKPISLPIYNFDGPGVALGMFNTDASIEGFARSCFAFALAQKMDLYLSTKDTILKTYDGSFKRIFAEIYKEYTDDFRVKGLTYEHRLIDDMVAFALRSEGGFVWAAKNYDGDVQSDALAQGYGSLGMMTSVLLTPDGKTAVTEAAHGTVTRHYYAFRRGEKTSTNPTASIFAWTGALTYRAKFDSTPEVADFARHLEQAVLRTINTGNVTKDLACGGKYLTTEQFFDAVVETLHAQTSHMAYPHHTVRGTL